jgi:hypothetical protein
MKHAEQVRLLEELLKKIDAGINANADPTLKNPTLSYRCPDIAAREWQTFFREHPQIVGMSGDLPERGSFLRSTISVRRLLRRETKMAGSMHLLTRVDIGAQWSKPKSKASAMDFNVAFTTGHIPPPVSSSRSRCQSISTHSTKRVMDYCRCLLLRNMVFFGCIRIPQAKSNQTSC